MVYSIAPIAVEIFRLSFGVAVGQSKNWNEKREHGLPIIPEPFAPKFISPLLPIVL